MRSFFDRKPAEKSQLDNAALLFIQFCQFVQRVVKGDQIETTGLEVERFIQRQPQSAIALGGAPAARVLDQNLPHQLSADGQEMLPVLKLTCALFFQTQISFVYQGRPLQSMVRTLVAQVVMRDPSQLVINKRDYSAQRLLITGLPVPQ